MSSERSDSWSEVAAGIGFCADASTSCSVNYDMLLLDYSSGCLLWLTAFLPLNYWIPITL